MIANVTQQYINKGQIQNCETCPVALCLNDMSNQKWIVSEMLIATIPYSCPWPYHRYIRTTSELAEWIRNFDFSGGPRTTPPRPISFHISAEAFMR